MLCHKKAPQTGATLIEMIIVIVLLGIIAVSVGIFVSKTIDGFDQAKQRLQAAQQAQLAMQVIKRELRLALPNSVRVKQSGGRTLLEWVPVQTGGRYRSLGAAGGDASSGCAIDNATLADNGILNVGFQDSCFKTIGMLDGKEMMGAKWVVVFNAGPGYDAADFYQTGASTGGNKALLGGVTQNAQETKVNFEPTIFKYDSPGHRFYLTKDPVSIECDPAAGVIRRWSGYPASPTQPTTWSGAVSGVLMNHVSACQIAYAPGLIASQFGLVTVSATKQTPSGDQIALQMQAQVMNAP